MDEKLLSRMWLNRALAHSHRQGKGVSSLWRSACADRARSFFHLGVLLLIVLVLAIRGHEPGAVSVSVEPGYSATMVVSTRDAPPGSTAPAIGSSLPRRHATSVGRTVVRTPPPIVQTLFQSPIPQTISAHPRTDVITHTVRAGEHLAGISARYGLQRETLVWSNEMIELDPGMLSIGLVLHILPVDGVYYAVQEGDTLDMIADRFHVKVETIVNCEYNTLISGESVRPGQRLIIPGGVKAFQPRMVQVQITPSAVDAPRVGSSFVWSVGGYISQGYWNLHRAIDISGKHGDVVMAADAGTVVYASWDRSGYGNLVIIDHGNGFTSYYAHLYGFYVDVGEQVEQGQPIGALGNTGNSTGPHLHFEIREQSVHRNPLGLLPKE